MAAVAGPAPGRALDAGMGQGRYAVYLAVKGWDGSGFDSPMPDWQSPRRNAEKALQADARSTSTLWFYVVR